MHRVDSSWFNMAVTNWRSGLDGDWSLVFHCTGLPVPLGNTATKPSFCPRAPNMVVSEWMTAPSSRPWKSTTNGLGVADPVEAADACAVGLGTPGAGVLRRYQRVAPSTSIFWRWLVNGPVCGVAQPEEGTAGPVATGAVVAAATPAAVWAVVEVEAVEVEQPALTATTSMAMAVMATVGRWVRTRRHAGKRSTSRLVGLVHPNSAKEVGGRASPLGAG